MTFIPETPFQVTDDYKLVYCLRHAGYHRRQPVWVNDVSVSITAPEEHRRVIALKICKELNGWFKPEATLCPPELT